MQDLPVQFLSSISKANPLLHLHLKLPIVFLHLPFMHIPGNTLHSLISIKKKKKKRLKHFEYLFICICIYIKGGVWAAGQTPQGWGRGNN